MTLSKFTFFGLCNGQYERSQFWFIVDLKQDFIIFNFEKILLREATETHIVKNKS